MPSEIIILPEEISNKIAAGEVVEKPYNVVKELLENAIDASADKIDIELRDGGFSLIKVTDNGIGILPDDIPKTIERFATSKIRSFEDIYNLRTYGFRGEALAAISSVSDFKISSRRNGYDGYTLIKNYGEPSEVKPSPIPHGTIVEVSNLFQKIPVRKKFLKNSNNEYKEIIKFVKQFASINYNVSITLSNDGEIVLDFSKDKKMFDRVKKVFNESNIFEVCNRYDNLRLNAVIGNPQCQKYRKDYIIIAVNKRIIKDYNIQQAVINAYNRLIPENRFPFAVLDIQISGNDVDINVHPTKSSVKFYNNNDIFLFIYDSIKNALYENALPKYTYNTLNDNNPKLSDISVKESHPLYEIDLSKQFQIEEVIQQNKREDKVIEKDNDNLKIIGQLFKTIILCEKDNELILIDQHIAHERVLFEKYKKSSTFIPTITLYEPILLDLESDEVDLFKNLLDSLKKYGFNMEFFGKKSIKITTIPTYVIKKDPTEEIKNIVSELISLKIPDDDKLPLILSCKNAIKSGDYLTTFEMEEIVRNLFQTSNPYTCPHGRPIFISISKETIFKKFQR
ncbi:MAG: DNA mismatch repair endonuclease MutL [Calditerrivibrio sp.]|nr:DNA mismatch repair endonuclease MutL [Calditerrivibrio sp.]